MKADRPPHTHNTGTTFAPDLSEGAEVGVYLALLELIDEGLIITGDEVIIDANSAACRLLGRSYRQIAGRPLAELFADEYAFLDARERLMIRGEERGTLALVLPDGRVHDFPYIAAPRLRPGIHAIVLGYENRSFDAAAGFRPPRAPGSGPLTLYFQPQIHARSGALHAGEALLHAPPEAATTHTTPHDARTLTAICRTASTWPHIQGHAPVVSINISAGQLRSGTLPKLISTALTASRLDPRSLELSLDAHTFALPPTELKTRLAPTLQTLADMQVRLALDNIGPNPDTVPLPLLARYHLDVLKLDATLTAQVGRHDGHTALIETLVQTAAPLGIQVLARGVQTRAQQDFLLALGCELQQGPLIGAAQDEHAFVNYLSDRPFC
jgi:EAL domain-containing protein (putative c-di-GMP-specific phosphodiesterase class I)